MALARLILAVAGSALLALASGGCQPGGAGAGGAGGETGDPRDRTGAAGPSRWGVIARPDGTAAAFLARPGAAPDLVLWCRGDGTATLRAHVFKDPAASPDLVLDSPQGAVTFTAVRAQGGLRAGSSTLVEGAVDLTVADTRARLAAATPEVTVRSSGTVWQAPAADPDGVMQAFVAGC